MLDAVRSENEGSALRSLQRIKLKSSQNTLSALLKKLSENKEKSSNIKLKQKLSPRDYPELVELKLAGKSEDEIAKKLGVGKQEVKIHSSKAMADFRSGKIKINAGNSVIRARELGEQKASAIYASSLDTPTPPILSVRI